MSLNNFFSKINPACFKVSCSYDEYARVRKSSFRVNATILYSLYQKLYPDTTVSYQYFYKKLKEHLYYDKYICKHGTEFIYYVNFVDTSVKVYPYLPYDTLQIIPAVSKNERRL